MLEAPPKRRGRPPGSKNKPDRDPGTLYEFLRWLFPTFKWVERIHKPVCEVYERHLDHVIKYRGKRGEGESQRITLCLMPRFSLKTTGFVVGFSLYALIRCPNIRILLGSRREDLSSKSLGSIKRIMEGYGPFIERFGRLKPESKDVDMRLAWAASGIIVATRTDLWLRERTIEVVGVQGLDPGYHYDIGLWDDPHGDDSPEQIDATWDAMQNFVPMLEPWGAYAVTMTRWDSFDVAYRMQAEWEQDLSEPVVFSPACDTFECKSLIPELYSDENLQSSLRKMGRDKFAKQFLLVPQDESEMRFPPEFYTTADEKRSEAKWLAITVDPNFGGRDERKNSRHGIIVLGWMPGGTAHVFDAMCGTWKEDELLNLIIELVKQWRPDVLGVERNALYNWIQMNLDMRFRKFAYTVHKRPQVVEFKPGTSSKETRIRGWVDDYKARRLTFAPKLTAEEEFKKELHAFPYGRLNDMLDALAGHKQIAEERSIPSDRSPVPAAMRERMNTLAEWHADIIAGKSEKWLAGNGGRSWRDC